MQTPKEYTKNLKAGIITKEMLSDCLFSVNKRAKNFRDRVREERYYCRHHYYCTYDYTDKLLEKENEYYEMKEQMLAYLKPACIHKEMQNHSERIRSCDFDDEGEFWASCEQAERDGLVCNENSYKDCMM